jgi:hypothetical protein
MGVIGVHHNLNELREPHNLQVGNLEFTHSGGQA